MKAKKDDKKTVGPVIKSTNQFPVVGIGASAGGLDAFKKLLKAIPEDSGMAYVLVQHLDPTHESLLPELLQKVTKIPVLEIADDIKVEPNHIYVIPSNKMMVASDGVLVLSPRPSKNKTERNLPIDIFFTSLAEVHQSHAIGVVLSGTATDGTLGLKTIKDHGGITFAQDEASAAYEGMPHSAVQAGVVDFILSPEKIPGKLLEVTSIINGKIGIDQNIALPDEEMFKQILALLRVRKGTDFTYYKQSTIRRRILRRMVLNKYQEPVDYLKYLRENKPEQDLLYQDLLIPVTAFFRDPKTFNNLCESVFPHIIKDKTRTEPLRVWVAGCSTGEEAYSIAVCIREFIGNDQHDVQIFATDLSEPAIAKARYGVYAKNDVAAVSPQRLQEFFSKTNGNYQVNKNVRDMCVFAHHNFLKDPPFGRMDFISCRNVLIYMEPYLQKKALTTFHYSLNPKGVLLLGKSETTGSAPELFSIASKNDKLFTRKDVPGKFIHVASQRSEQNYNQVATSLVHEPIRTDLKKTADDIMLRKYTPAGVVVNEAMDIVHFRGKTSNFLEQSPGKPSHNLLQMAKSGLAFELRNILHKAKKEKAQVIKKNIPMEIDGGLRNICIEAIPLPNVIEPHYLVLFHDSETTGNGKPASNSKKPATSKIKRDEKDLRIYQLEKELALAREDMRSITEDQDAANEELQSANEELLSSSEELQSLNEELETGKEELQSTNEELMVVNQETLNLNEQLTFSRNYANSVIATIREPLLVLDKNLRIQTANQAFYKTFHVNEKDTEGRLIYELGEKQWNIPQLRVLLEDILPKRTQFANFEVRYRFQNIGERIMLLNGREILRDHAEDKLILLSIEDVTEKVKLQDQEKELLGRFQSLLMQAPVAIMVLKGKDYNVELANDSYLQLVEKEKDFIGRSIFDSLPELKAQGIKDLLDKVMQNGTPFYGNEMEIHMLRSSKKEQGFYNFAYHPIREHSDSVTGIIVVATDVTEQVIAKNKNLEDHELRQKELEQKVRERTLELNEANQILLQKNQEIEEARIKLMSEYSRTLIEASLDPMVIINIEGKITDMNRATFNITGLPGEKLKGSNFFDYFTEPVKAREVYKQVFTKGSVINSPLTIRHVDGHLTDVFLNGSVYKDASTNIAGVVLVARDVTEQKKISKELTEAIIFAEMATVIAEDAKLRAEDAVKSKQQFLSNMSHEIRTPMNAIIGFTKVLLKTNLSEKQKEYLQAIKLSGDALIVLINDILDLAKVDSGKMTFEQVPFKIASSISAIIHLFEPKIHEKNLSLIKEYDNNIPEVLLGDPVRLHQVILNLVSNAVKFTAKGKITVNVHLLREDEKSVTIQFSVTDTGIGIPENKIEKIFDNFQQASSGTSRLYGGTGLGLAIVKQLVEAQGGSIQVISKIDEGSTFSIILNFQKTSAEVVVEKEMFELDNEIKNINVLIVEDIALNQLLLKTLLDDFGFEHDTAVNGKIAIEKLQENSYDIILMDLQMPEMNGFEATDYIRNKMNSKIPIIALTADVTTVDLAKCKAVGMNDYIAKPVDEKLLYNKIIEFVKKPAMSGGPEQAGKIETKKLKYTNLAYLMQRTKSDPALMMEMISLYLEQTPHLIKEMKQGFLKKDWKSLHAAVHKMIPSFLIVGINADYETMAKKVQEYAGTQMQSEGIHEMVLQLENVCEQACIELQEELTTIKNKNL